MAGPFVAGRALKIVHAPGCTHAKRISQKNRLKFDTLDAASAAGKELCPKCLPPVKPEAEAPTEPAKAGAEPGAPTPVPSTPSKAALLEDIATPAPPKVEEPKPSPLREAIDALRPAVPRLAARKPRDQEWWAYFSGWWMKFHDASTYAVAPTMVWLAAFYLVFLLQPFVYHLRASRPIAGERFFMAVSNAAGMFGWAYAILHKGYSLALGLVTIAMAGSYLVLGAVTRRRVRDDVRAVFAFIALSVMFLTLAPAVLLDYHAVTGAWAVKAPVLLYLAYRYRYFPVRAGALVPPALAALLVSFETWQ